MIQKYRKVYNPLMFSYRSAKNRFVITSVLKIKRRQAKVIVEKPYSMAFFLNPNEEFGRIRSEAVDKAENWRRNQVVAKYSANKPSQIQ